MSAGRVYIVGAGPGDPGLITVRGKDLLGRADTVFYDYLVSPELLEYAPGAAEKIYVGKMEGRHTVPQERINEFLVEKAREGKTVVRLKGGDPFIFGRGGEEAQTLAGAGIDFEIVPGVTSAIAAPAYAGIPLTHRGLASSVEFITGHEDPGKQESFIPWEHVAGGRGTLVFLMGVMNLPSIVKELVKHGRAPSTPIALVHRGTLPEQRTVVSTLGGVVKAAEQAALSAPAVIVVGEVVGLRDELRWFEKRPLLGKTIVVTRARQQASGLASLLAGHGARVVEFPTIKIEPPASYDELDRAVGSLASFDWIVFTSTNGVEHFAGRVAALGRDMRALAGLTVAAIGKATAEELAARGIAADFVPGEYSTEGMLKELSGAGVKGKRMLLPRVEDAPLRLVEGLRELGAEPVEAAAYRTVPASGDAGRLAELVEGGNIDLVTFASSSTVRNFVACLDGCGMKGRAQGIKAAAIGPVTAGAAREAGFSVEVEPGEYTVPALVEEIVGHFTAGGAPTAARPSAADGGKNGRQG